jgi:hypothetical protein
MKIHKVKAGESQYRVSGVRAPGDNVHEQSEVTMHPLRSQKSLVGKRPNPTTEASASRHLFKRIYCSICSRKLDEYEIDSNKNIGNKEEEMICIMCYEESAE